MEDVGANKIVSYKGKTHLGIQEKEKIKIIENVKLEKRASNDGVRLYIKETVNCTLGTMYELLDILSKVDL